MDLNAITIAIASGIGGAIGGGIVTLVFRRSLGRYDKVVEKVDTFEKERFAKLEKKVEDSNDCKSCENTRKVGIFEHDIKDIKRRLGDAEVKSDIVTEVNTKLKIFIQIMTDVKLKVDSISDLTSKQDAEIKNTRIYVGNVSRNLKDHEKNFHHNK